jgi:hypothetical protein
LLIRLARHEANHPSGEGRMSALILHERTRWLRN